MTDPKQGANGPGSGDAEATQVRSAKDFYGNKPEPKPSRADRIMGRAKPEAGGTPSPAPARSAGNADVTGPQPTRASQTRPASQPTPAKPASAQSKPSPSQPSKPQQAAKPAAATSGKPSFAPGKPATAANKPGQNQSAATGAKTPAKPGDKPAEKPGEKKLDPKAKTAAAAAGIGAAGGALAARLKNLRGGSTEAAAGETKSAAASTGQTTESTPAVRGARRTRKARLRLAKVDPWSVMKTALLFSVAGGIVLVVATLLVWVVTKNSGLFESVNSMVTSVVSPPGATAEDGFRIEQYLTDTRVIGTALAVAAIDVVIFTALATLGAFLYNLAASMIGGLEVTLAED